MPQRSFMIPEQFFIEILGILLVLIPKLASIKGILHFLTFNEMSANRSRVRCVLLKP